jgi:hypothetical protein
MQLIDQSQQLAQLKTAKSARTEPQSKLSAQWKVVEGKLRCFWVAKNTSNHNH